DDHVAPATFDEVKAGAIAACEIADAEPSVDLARSRRLVVVVIAGDDQLALYVQLADLTWRDVALAVAEQSDVVAGHGPADRSRRGAEVARICEGDEPRLGRAVEVVEDVSVPIHERDRQRPGQRCAAREHDA